MGPAICGADSAGCIARGLPATLSNSAATNEQVCPRHDQPDRGQAGVIVSDAGNAGSRSRHPLATTAGIRDPGRGLIRRLRQHRFVVSVTHAKARTGRHSQSESDAYACRNIFRHPRSNYALRNYRHIPSGRVGANECFSWQAPGALRRQNDRPWPRLSSWQPSVPRRCAFWLGGRNPRVGRTLHQHRTAHSPNPLQ